MIFGEGPIIKNIAGNLNKLFLQGSRVGQPITNVEGDAAADQGTIALMADRDPVIRDISTGLGYAAGREVTVSGTGPLPLVNSIGRALTRWSVELAPYQEGSGDPSPQNIRRIYGTDKLNWFVEETYQSAAPKEVITLLQTIFGGTLGSAGNEIAWGVADLGELNWGPSSPDLFIYRSDALRGTILPSSASLIPTDAMCEQFAPMAWGPISASDNKKFAVADINAGLAGRVVFIDHRFNSISDFISAVSGVKLVFPLLTPQPLAISIPSMPTISGSAVAWMTAEYGNITNLSATYIQGE